MTLINSKQSFSNRIKAVIFDMDGLLIDSELLWQQALTEVFASLGREFGEKEFREVQGMRIDLYIAYWYDKQPWSDYSIAEVAGKVVDRAIALIKERGVPKAGALRTVNFFRERGIPLGIASSSPHKIINANISALGAEDCFDVICSADNERYGKPHPAVYISTAEQLNIPRRQCLVFEDSVLGVLSAKSAEMTCICVPDESVAVDKRLGIADYVLPSLDNFDDELWQRILRNG